jgi:thymidylate synthase
MHKPYQAQYYELLHELMMNPDKEVKTRVGDARSRFSEKMKIDLRSEFPLMNIKQTSFKNIYVELLWFIAGDTNIKFLVDNKCYIWNDDAFRWYNEKYVPLGAPKLEKEVWLEKVKNGEKIYLNHTQEKGNFSFDVETHMSHPLWFRQSTKVHTYGDLDIVYGRQWRNFAGKVDQLSDAIAKLKSDPDDRRMIIIAHNPADIKDGNVGLPSCHNYMQFYTQPIPLANRVKYGTDNNLLTPELIELTDKYVYYKGDSTNLKITKEVLGDINNKLDNVGIPKRYISVLVNIRSNDYFLGNPYNVASYATLLSMVAQCVDMIPMILSIEMVDCHLYVDHLDAAGKWIDRVNEQLAQAPDMEAKRQLFQTGAKLKINPAVKNINDFTLSDCKIEDYVSLGRIDAPLLT